MDSIGLSYSPDTPEALSREVRHLWLNESQTMLNKITKRLHTASLSEDAMSDLGDSLAAVHITQKNQQILHTVQQVQEAIASLKLLSAGDSAQMNYVSLLVKNVTDTLKRMELMSQGLVDVTGHELTAGMGALQVTEAVDLLGELSVNLRQLGIGEGVNYICENTAQTPLTSRHQAMPDTCMASQQSPGNNTNVVGESLMAYDACKVQSLQPLTVNQCEGHTHNSLFDDTCETVKQNFGTEIFYVNQEHILASDDSSEAISITKAQCEKLKDNLLLNVEQSEASLVDDPDGAAGLNLADRRTAGLNKNSLDSDFCEEMNHGHLGANPCERLNVTLPDYDVCAVANPRERLNDTLPDYDVCVGLSGSERSCSRLPVIGAAGVSHEPPDHTPLADVVPSFTPHVFTLPDLVMDHTAETGDLLEAERPAADNKRTHFLDSLGIS